jgi:hypothetical protein
MSECVIQTYYDLLVDNLRLAIVGKRKCIMTKAGVDGPIDFLDSLCAANDQFFIDYGVWDGVVDKGVV